MKKTTTMTLSSALEEAWKKDLNSLSPDLNSHMLKGYLKKDLKGIYSLIDDNCSIKLIFDDGCMNSVLKEKKIKQKDLEGK